jgi:hypothetical protein
MKPRVYIETTIPSYLTARPSQDLIILAHQVITREWWEIHSKKYELCTSELVLNEAGGGDPLAAHERLTALKPLLLLETKREALELARELLKATALPAKAENDALHVAIAATQEVPFLLTWNCRHIANPHKWTLMRQVCFQRNVELPIICTPDVLKEQP